MASSARLRGDDVADLRADWKLVLDAPRCMGRGGRARAPGLRAVACRGDDSTAGFAARGAGSCFHGAPPTACAPSRRARCAATRRPRSTRSTTSRASTTTRARGSRRSGAWWKGSAGPSVVLEVDDAEARRARRPPRAPLQERPRLHHRRDSRRTSAMRGPLAFALLPIDRRRPPPRMCSAYAALPCWIVIVGQGRSSRAALPGALVPAGGCRLESSLVQSGKQCRRHGYRLAANIDSPSWAPRVVPCTGTDSSHVRSASRSDSERTFTCSRRRRAPAPSWVARGARAAVTAHLPRVATRRGHGRRSARGRRGRRICRTGARPERTLPGQARAPLERKRIRSSRAIAERRCSTDARAVRALAGNAPGWTRRSTRRCRRRRRTSCRDRRGPPRWSTSPLRSRANAARRPTR